MAIMNRIESSAIETEFQGLLLLVEAKNDIEQERKYSEGDYSKGVWRNRKFAH
jgi:hypothetical protein